MGPAVEVISKKVVEAGPGKCPFETRHKFTTERLSGKRYCNICWISFVLGFPFACFYCCNSNIVVCAWSKKLNLNKGFNGSLMF